MPSGGAENAELEKITQALRSNNVFLGLFDRKLAIQYSSNDHQIPHFSPTMMGMAREW